MKLPLTGCPGRFAFIAAAFVAFSALPALAADATWLGTTDSLWATESNWSPTPVLPDTVPAAAETATFDNAGNGNTMIHLGSGVTIGNIFFGSGAASYTLGTGGDQSLTLDNTGSIIVNAGVTQAQVINSTITLGTTRDTATTTIINNGSFGLTFSGAVSGAPAGGTAGTKTIAIGGTGDVTFNGGLSRGSATRLVLTKAGTGLLRLNGTATLGSPGAAGALAIIGGDIDLGTTGRINLTGSTTNFAINHSGISVINGGELTSQSIISSTGSLIIDSKITSMSSRFQGNGSVTLTHDDNSFGQNLWVGTSGTLGFTVAGALGNGLSIVFGHSNSANSRLLFIGTDGAEVSKSLSYGPGANNVSVRLEHSGSGLLKFTGDTNFPGATGSLRLQGSTTGTAEYSGAINSNSPVFKSGSGTWTLSGTNSYATSTTISDGVLSVATIGNGGEPGNLGQATADAANLVLDGGTLRYSGGNASTDRSFTLSAGKSSGIEVTANTLTLTGSAPSSSGSLIKSGDGTLVLASPSLHSGGTTIAAGTLRLEAIGAAGVATAPLMLDSGSLVLAADSGFTTHPVTLSGDCILVTDRATSGPAINHAFGKLTMGTSTLTIAQGANINSGNTSVSFTSTDLTGDATFHILDGTSLALGYVTDANSGHGITATGTGILVIDQNSTHTGDTTVPDGTLALTEGGRLKFAVSNSSNNVISGGEVILDGGFAIDTSAFVGRVAQDWTLVDAVNATYSPTFHVVGFTPDAEGGIWIKAPILTSETTWAFHTATGQLFAIPGPPTAYELWAADLANPAFDFDSDGDGLSNGLEWILGGAPSIDDSATISPTITGNAASGLTLVFNRLPESVDQTTLIVEWGSSPDHFPNFAVIGSVDVPARGYEPTIHIDSPQPGMVTVFIPAANAVNGQLYARLMAYEGAGAIGYDVFLLIGQSNMDGRGGVAALTSVQQAATPDHLIFYHNSRATTPDWTALAPGYATRTAETTLPSNNFGCELSFAPAIVPALPGRKVALVKASEGSTSLSFHWNPSDHHSTAGRCYRTALDALNMAVSKLPPGPHRLRGVLWHQGESDAGDAPTTYENKLTKLISRLREDLKSPDLPFVMGELFGNWRTNITPAQQAVVAKVPFTALASSDGMTSGDGIHFDGAGQWEFGIRYADAMKELLPQVIPVILESHVVPTLRIPPSAYAAWATSLPIPDFEADSDGIANGLKWILGGDPTQSAPSSILPAATGHPDNGLTLVFNRLPASVNESTLTVEWGSDLTFPNSLFIGNRNVGPNGNKPTIEVDVPSIGKVTVRIPAAHAENGKLFSRLKATRP